MKYHALIHTGEKPYSCNHCAERFTRLQHLKTHLLNSHNGGSWFTCHICHKKFVRNYYLNRHISRHEVAKPYVCSECPKRFCTADELKVHLLAH